MIDVNWDENAKAAAMEFACYIGKAKDCERYFKHIAPKTKTVADAVEYYNGVWPEEKDAVCVWDDKRKNFEFWISDYEPVSYCYEVCNYEQFEAYAKEREAKITMDDINEHISTGEQEGEKWTHMYKLGDSCKWYPCKIKGEVGTQGIVIEADVFEGVQYCSFFGKQAVTLKPIKPAMTAKDEAVIVEFMKSSHNL